VRLVVIATTAAARLLENLFFLVASGIVLMKARTAGSATERIQGE
jgi:hypothetical protein